MEHDEYISLIRKMERVLAAAQEQRKDRQKWVDGEPEWILFERQTMIDAVQTERKTRGMEPVPTERILYAETSASGHVDYSHKFALYCAELIRDGKLGPIY